MSFVEEKHAFVEEICMFVEKLYIFVVKKMTNGSFRMSESSNRKI